MTRTNGQQSSLDKIATIIENKRTLPGALLPILHDIQHEFGYIPKNALPILAKQLQQTEAEIYGVISFLSLIHI